MKLRKLALCMGLGFLLICSLQVNTSAAEEVMDNVQITEDVDAADVASIHVTDLQIQEKEEIEEKDGLEVKDEIKVKTGAKKNTKKKEKRKNNNYTKGELRLMSAIIYCEANGESYSGKKAVGIVIMNRMRSNSFPNTLKGVIYQSYQFGPVRNGSLNRALANWDSGRFNSSAAKQCVKAAKAALNGERTVMLGSKPKNLSGYRYFSGGMSAPRLRIGNHLFK